MRDAVINVEYCGEKLCAKLVDHDYEEVSSHDFKNPNPAMRARPLLGVAILDGLKMVSEKKWTGGVLYDPRTGRSYISKIKLLDNERIKITGCIAPKLCKGYIWTRVAS